jgi:hypothetical protein
VGELASCGAAPLTADSKTWPRLQRWSCSPFPRVCWCLVSGSLPRSPPPPSSRQKVSVTVANNYFSAFVHDLDARTQATTSSLQRCTRRPSPPRTSCLTPTPPLLWCRPPAPATSRPRPLPPPLPPTLGSQCPLVRASTNFLYRLPYQTKPAKKRAFGTSTTPRTTACRRAFCGLRSAAACTVGGHLRRGNTNL